MEEQSVLPPARGSAEAEPVSEAGDALDGRIASTPPRNRPAALVDHFAPAIAGDSLDWIAEVARRCERYALSAAETRSAVTDLAWMARTNGQRYPNAVEWEFARGVAGSGT